MIHTSFHHNCTGLIHRLHHLGGIYTCVDAAAKEAPYFLGQIFNCEAEDILRNSAIGSFVVYDDKIDLNCLHLAYVHDGGKIERRTIQYLKHEHLLQLQNEPKSKVRRPSVQKCVSKIFLCTLTLSRSQRNLYPLRT